MVINKWQIKRCIDSMVNISSLGITRLIFAILASFPPSFPVKAIVCADTTHHFLQSGFLIDF